MDSFNIESGTLQEVQRLNDGMLQSLRDQGRELERNAQLAAQIRQDVTRGGGGGGSAYRPRRRGQPASGLDQEFELQPVDEPDRYRIAPRSDAILKRESFERQLDEAIRRKADELEGRSRGTSNSFRRTDVRNVEGLVRMLRGDVNVHSLHQGVNALGSTELGKAVGLDKASATIEQFAGHAMIAQQIADAGVQAVRDMIKNESDASHARGRNIDLARDVGLSGNARKSLESQIAANFDREKKAALFKAQQKLLNADANTWKGWHDSAQALGDIYADFYNRLTGGFDVDKQAQQQHAIKVIEELHKHPGLANRLVSREEIFRRAPRGASNVDLNEIRDQLLIQKWKEGDSLLYQEENKNRPVKDADLQHEIRLKWDIQYAATWRHRENLTKEIERQQIMQRQGWNEY